MSYASTSIDRRAEYYARSAAVIAADPLDFYTRAERGRRFQASQLTVRTPGQRSQGVVHYLNPSSHRDSLLAAHGADPVLPMRHAVAMR